MKLAWYAIRNIIMALIVAAIGTAAVAANDINSLISMLVGICLILGGLNSFSKTSWWVSLALILLGIGAISLGETVLKDNDASRIVSSVLLAVVGGTQIQKIFTSYGRRGWQRALTKALAIIIPVSLIAGSIVSIFMQNKGLSTTFYELGAFSWIAHTVLVIVYTKQTAAAGGNYNKSGSSASASYGGANQATVTNKMKSLANYLTGGFDTLGYGVSVTYAVNVSVSSGTIKFTLSGRISGADSLTSEAQVNSVKGSLERAFDRRSQLIIDEAQKELAKIEPDCDYSIEVVGGDIS